MQNQELDELFLKRRGLIKPGIEAISLALRELAISDVFAIPHVLIAGTNGKGTTAGFLYAMQENAGLYSSPHIHSFCERFLFADGIAKSKEVLACLDELKAHLSAKTYETLSFFDISTLIALLLFRQRKVEKFILEVGLGGRLDSTNCSDPNVSVITSIALDHVEYLGSSLSGIAQEKAGVLRPGRPAVLGGQNAIPASARSAIISTMPQNDFYIQGEHFGIKDNLFWYDDPIAQIRKEAQVQTHDWPDFLVHNLSVAMMAQYLWQGTLADFSQPLSILSSYIPTFWGRAQRRHFTYQNKLIKCYLDVGHNSQCIEELVKYQKQSQEECIVAMTCMRDKQWHDMVTELKDNFSQMLFFTNEHERALSSEDFAAAFPTIPAVGDFSSVLAQIATSDKSELNLVVTGSVMGLAEVLAFIDNSSNSHQEGVY